MARDAISTTSRVAQALLGKIGAWLPQGILTELNLVARLNDVVDLQTYREADEQVIARIYGPEDNTPIYVDNNVVEGVPIGTDDILGGWGFSADQPFASLRYAQAMAGLDGFKRPIYVAPSSTSYKAKGIVAGGWFDRIRPYDDPITGDGYDGKVWSVGAGSAGGHGYTATSIVDGDGVAAAWTADEHKTSMRFLLGTGGDMDGKLFYVKANGADSMRFMSMNDNAQPTVPDLSTSTFTIHELPVEIELEGNTTFNNVGVWYCKVTGDYEVVAQGDMQFFLCGMAVQNLYMPDGGELKWMYILNQGKGPVGHLLIVGRIKSQHVLIDGTNYTGGASSSWDAVTMAPGSGWYVTGSLTIMNMEHPLRLSGANMGGNPLVPAGFVGALHIGACVQPIQINPAGRAVGGGLGGLNLYNEESGTDGITGQAQVVNVESLGWCVIPSGGSNLTGSTSVDAIAINGVLIGSGLAPQDDLGTICIGSTENPEKGYTQAP